MAAPITPEMLADYFVSYLFTKYHGTRHVRRIASWIGFVIKGIEKVVGANLHRNRARQIRFDYHNRQFKVRYNHGAGGRGGIQIVEVLSGRGAPEGHVVANIVSLADAERIYQRLGQELSAFLAAHPTI
jgi:hypothetical protein